MSRPAATAESGVYRPLIGRPFLGEINPVLAGLVAGIGSTGGQVIEHHVPYITLMGTDVLNSTGTVLQTPRDCRSEESIVMSGDILKRIKQAERRSIGRQAITAELGARRLSDGSIKLLSYVCLDPISADLRDEAADLRTLLAPRKPGRESDWRYERVTAAAVRLIHPEIRRVVELVTEANAAILEAGEIRLGPPEVLPCLEDPRWIC
jgi:hypothetical protein